MKNYFKGFLSGMLALALILVCVTAFDRSGAASSNASLTPVFAKMQQIQRLVDDKFYFEQDAEKIADGAYAGMIYGLDDKFSAYLTPRQYEQSLRSLQGNYTGIGATVHQDNETLETIVITVDPEGPAAKAGMQEDDVIVAVDGVDVSQMLLTDIIYDYIMGEVDTQVTITVERDGKRLDLPMTRKNIIDQTVNHQMLDDKTGYLQLTSFEDESVEQFKSAIEDMQKQGMERIVYDLRGNGGGSLSSVIDMLDYLLPDGLLVYTEDKDGNRLESYEGEDEHEVDIPAVILVDKDSASASEVFSSAMRDYGRAQLVGTQTYGKGIVQKFFPLEDGSAIKLTVSAYFTKSGTPIQGEGLTPDVEVEMADGELKDPFEELDAAQDAQLEAGIRALEEQARKSVS
ncbi:MAG: S41 family peptidase [Christensenella sp.]|uniref:S41 family peptidase n=1 Tax=Christensenella sp. TaxID=1935934 RepID=UPI002B205367|nr:S41 family peptidase [Christensenella sp.]MEA5003219.1 S41 family peptidase [Christensenella sp.]